MFFLGVGSGERPKFPLDHGDFLVVEVSITIIYLDPPRVSNVSPKKVCFWWLRAAQLSHQLEDSGTNMYHRFMGSMILAKS